MMGMRDKLIHSYFGVDTLIVWLSINEDLPLLKKQVENVLHEYNSHF